MHNGANHNGQAIGAGGLALLDDASIAALHQTLAGAGGLYAPARVLFSLVGANMNSTADQQFTKLGTFTSWIFGPNGSIRVVNPSASCASCVGGIYSATSKGGDAILAASQTYASLGATTPSGVSVTQSVAGGALRSDSAIYLSLSTPQGSAATADWYIIGVPLS